MPRPSISKPALARLRRPEQARLAWPGVEERRPRTGPGGRCSACAVSLVRRWRTPATRGLAAAALRRDTPGRAYYRRRLAEGKTTMEALRALKRHLSDVVYKRMLH